MGSHANQKPVCLHNIFQVVFFSSPRYTGIKDYTFVGNQHYLLTHSLLVCTTSLSGTSCMHVLYMRVQRCVQK